VTALVCGGRTYADQYRVFATLDALRPSAVVVGGATGADALAERWARESGVPCRVFRADWQKHGKAAGPIRNSEMLENGKPDIVVAFAGGKGTEDMMRQASRRGVRVVYHQ